MKKILVLLAIILSSFKANASTANIVKSSSIEATSLLENAIKYENPWIRLPAETAKNTAAYVKLYNESDVDLKLVSAEAIDGFERTEIHGYKPDNIGIKKMFRLDLVTIPSKSYVEFKPSYNHIMLLGIKNQLESGDVKVIKFTFVSADMEKHPNEKLVLNVNFEVK